MHSNLLAAVFDAIQDGICVLDRELNIVRTNRVIEEMFADQAPLAGKKCYHVFKSRDSVCDDCVAVRALASGRRETSEATRQGDGEFPHTLALSAFPLYDDDDELTGIVEYVRDITEQKRVDSLLTQRANLYQSLFENNVAVMLVVDPETAAVVDANPRACSYYGHTREEITQLKITDINAMSREQIFEEMRLASAERRIHLELRHRLAGGEIREVEVFSGPLTVGNRSLLCYIVHDVSERRSNERERERLIGELQRALSEVKTLRGFLPICSSCKKIRDDTGYWNQIETYIAAHSEAEFSHSMCPECSQAFYPELELEG